MDISDILETIDSIKDDVVDLKDTMHLAVDDFFQIVTGFMGELPKLLNDDDIETDDSEDEDTETDGSEEDKDELNDFKEETNNSKSEN